MCSLVKIDWREREKIKMNLSGLESKICVLYFKGCRGESE